MSDPFRYLQPDRRTGRAVRWTGENLAEVRAFLERWTSASSFGDGGELSIDLGPGRLPLTVEVGQWVVKPEGEEMRVCLPGWGDRISRVRPPPVETAPGEAAQADEHDPSLCEDDDCLICWGPAPSAAQVITVSDQAQAEKAAALLEREEPPRNCWKCGGHGKLLIQHSRCGSSWSTPCPCCDGTGRFVRYGDGTIYEAARGHGE